MTPEEKANELIVKFAAHAAGSTGDQNWINAKNCAIIAVDEIITELFNSQSGVENKIRLEYWQEVKNHLNQM